MSLGLKRGVVKLVPHNQKWKELFKTEKNILLSKFPKLIHEISHGGSTAIPTISAKPIIDMFARVTSLNEVKDIRQEMQKLGYFYRGEEDVPGRILYAKGSEESRTHYVHFVEGDSDEWKNHLLIKNYFLKYPDKAVEYEKLKKSLAKKYPNDRKSYSSGKDAFIKEVILKSNLDK